MEVSRSNRSAVTAKLNAPRKCQQVREIRMHALIVTCLHVGEQAQPYWLKSDSNDTDRRLGNS